MLVFLGGALNRHFGVKHSIFSTLLRPLPITPKRRDLTLRRGEVTVGSVVTVMTVLTVVTVTVGSYAGVEGGGGGPSTYWGVFIIIIYILYIYI